MSQPSTVPYPLAREIDKLEGGAYLVWRRFNSARFVSEVLSINFDTEIDHSWKYPFDVNSTLPRPEFDYEREVFRGFNCDDMALVQTGRLVSLKEAGLTGSQSVRYHRLQHQLIGLRLVADLTESLGEENDYHPMEIVARAKELGNEHINRSLENVLFAFGVIELARDAKIVPDVPRPNFKKRPAQQDAPDIKDIIGKNSAPSYAQLQERVENLVAKIDELIGSKRE